MNFEFDFFGIDRLFTLPLNASAEPAHEDWILVSLHTTRRSWLLLNLDRTQWRDETAALELANIIAARKLADCDGLSLGTPQWMNDLQKRQLPQWLEGTIELGEGRWAESKLPPFKGYLIAESRASSEQ